MKNKINKSGKTHTIYAIYDEVNDELSSVSLDYEMLDMQLQLGDFDRNRFNIVEFDIKLT